MSTMDLPTVHRLRKVQEIMKGDNFKNLRSNIHKLLTGELNKFKLTFGPHIWRGYVYRTSNSLYGTIFSYWDNIPFIVRGYPKIKYTESTDILNKYCSCEEKPDGTNLGLFLLPNGKFMGKTRETVTIERVGYKGQRWDKLLEKTGTIPAIQKLLKDNYRVFGELYGTDNPGDFIRYTVPIAFQAFDIVDVNSLAFLPPKKKYDLFYEVGLPFTKVYWEGFLNNKELSRLEYELQKYVTVDGMEGIIAKYYNSKIGDTEIAKIKCKEISELCWSMSPRKTIPRGILAKAIRKAWENFGTLQNQEEVLEFVIKELGEEFEEDKINSSIIKIKRMITEFFLSKEGDIFEVMNYLKEMEEKGIEVSIENKNKIMSMIASKFKGYSAGNLYSIFMAYVK